MSCKSKPGGYALTVEDKIRANRINRAARLYVGDIEKRVWPAPVYWAHDPAKYIAFGGNLIPVVGKRRETIIPYELDKPLTWKQKIINFLLKFKP